MSDKYDELKSKDKQIRKLALEAGVWQSRCYKYENRIAEIEAEHDRFKDECEQIKASAAPLQATVDSLTAERSKFLRKLKRFENK